MLEVRNGCVEHCAALTRYSCACDGYVDLAELRSCLREGDSDDFLISSVASNCYGPAANAFDLGSSVLRCSGYPIQNGDVLSPDLQV